MINTLMGIPLRFLILPFLILLVIIEARRWFTRDEQKSWLEETWSFMKTIFRSCSSGSLSPACSVRSSREAFSRRISIEYGGCKPHRCPFRDFMYFPTLVEVPMAKMFLDLEWQRARCLPMSSPIRSSRSPVSLSSGNTWKYRDYCLCAPDRVLLYTCRVDLWSFVG